MAEDDTHIIPPDQDPPPSPLHPGAESAASASRPNLDSDPVLAEGPTTRRQATPGNPPAGSAPSGGPDPLPLPPQPSFSVPTPPPSQVPPLQPEHPSGIAGASVPEVPTSGTVPPLPDLSPEGAVPAVPSVASQGNALSGAGGDGVAGGMPMPPGTSPAPEGAPPGMPAVTPGAPPGVPGASPGVAPGMPGAPPGTPSGVPGEDASAVVPSPSADQNLPEGALDMSQAGSSSEDRSSDLEKPSFAPDSPQTQAEGGPLPAGSADTTKKEPVLDTGKKKKKGKGADRKEGPKDDTPASKRQPAYQRSPYEKSLDRDKKNKQLLWALSGSGFVLAIVALLLGLGVLQIGSSQISSSEIAAGAIGTKQIAPGSIDEANLNSKLQEDIFGKVGPKGPAGPKGDRGPKGAAGISSIQVVDQQVSGSASDDEISGVALCPNGQVALSGGALLSGGAASLSASEPATGLSGWRANAVRQEGASGSWNIKVYVICAAPSQGLLDSIG